MNRAEQTVVVEGGAYADTTVIIPTRNEAEGIIVILRLLDQMYPGIGICVVDDRSSDGTREIVDKYFQGRNHLGQGFSDLIERDVVPIQGLTASVLDAILSCRSDYFIVMDADLQHPPELLPELRDVLQRGSNLAIGFRVGNPKDWPLSRRLVSFLGSGIARGYLRLFGISSRDPLSGYFGGRTSTIQKIIKESRYRFEERGYKILLDLLKVATRNGLSSGNITSSEVPYRLQGRTSGYSKFRLRHGYYFLCSLLR